MYLIPWTVQTRSFKTLISLSLKASTMPLFSLGLIQITSHRLKRGQGGWDLHVFTKYIKVTLCLLEDIYI